MNHDSRLHDRFLTLLSRSRHRRVLWLSLLIPLVAGCGLLQAIYLFLDQAVSPPAALVGVQLIADGLVAPVALVEPPDGTGRLFVVDQAGRIRVIDFSGSMLVKPFLDVAPRMVAISPVSDERGLLGLAFHPQYAANGRFFVFYVAPKLGDIPAAFDSEIRVSEFAVMSGDANCADPASERIILRIGNPQANHNGGQLAFGPDGFLYIAVGDGGSASDEGTGHTPGIGNAQDKSNLLGKILRINVDGAQPYEGPPSNPFVGEPGAQPEIFALGLRNAWRFSFERGGAQRLFAGDVGQNLFEEVNIITNGGNYGWRVREGLACYDRANPASPPPTCAQTGPDGAPLIDPIFDYPHDDSQGGVRGIAVIGGFIYDGTAIPGLTGRYVFGDFSTTFFFTDGSLYVAQEGLGGVWTLSELGIRNFPGQRLGRVVLGMGQDAAGELYVLTSAMFGPSGTTGQVYKIIP